MTKVLVGTLDDVADLIPDGYFDLIVCNDVLEHIVDTDKALCLLKQKMVDSAWLVGSPNPVPGARNSSPAEGGLFEYRKNTAYCIATQAGIWNRGFLQSLARGKASIWEFERYGSFQVGEESRPLLVTPTKEFPFIDAVHKGHWEKFGVKCLTDNGIDYDFSKRGLPPFKVRVVEGLKAFIFAVVPNNWIVRVQNVLDVGARKRTAAGPGANQR